MDASVVCDTVDVLDTDHQILSCPQGSYHLIGTRKTQVFWHQSEARMAATVRVWNWSGKTLSLGALLAVLYFSSCLIFPPV